MEACKQSVQQATFCVPPELNCSYQTLSVLRPGADYEGPLEQGALLQRSKWTAQAVLVMMAEKEEGDPLADDEETSESSDL